MSVLGVLRKTLTANKKYLVQNCQNLLSPFQIVLSEKIKTFYQFFVPFLESTSNFEHSEKKNMILIANLFFKLQTVKDLVRPLSKKQCFRTPFESQHVKGCQTVVKSA